MRNNLMYFKLATGSRFMLVTSGTSLLLVTYISTVINH